MATEKNKTLKREILVIASVIALLFILVFGVVASFTIRKQAANREKEIIFNRTIQLRNELQASLDHAMGVARNMAHVYKTALVKENPASVSANEADQIMKEALRNNEAFHGSFTIWEPDVAGNRGMQVRRNIAFDETGRYVPYWRQDSLGNFAKQACMYYNTEGVGNYYIIPRRRMRESIIDPFLYPYQHVNQEIISLVAPVISQNRFYGVAGIDLPVSEMQRIIGNFSIHEGEGTVSLLSNRGIYAATTKSDTLIGTSLENLHENYNEQVVEIQNATQRYLMRDDVLEVKVPLVAGNTEMPWQLRAEIPAEAVYQQANRELTMVVFLAALLLIAGFAVLYLYINSFTRLLNKLIYGANQLSHGNLHTNIDVNKENEIGRLSHELKGIKSYMQEIEDLSKALSTEDFSSSIQLKGEEDELGRAVNRMTEELHRIDKENEQQRQEAEIRNWSRNGLAELGAILNQRTENLEDFAYAILEQVLDYLGITVGGLYIYKKAEEERELHDDILELKAAYAFDRRKHIDRRIQPGEGLVGTCAREREMIYMTRIPKGYVEISGGLGNTRPQSLLLYPLIEQDELQGILELASLKPLEDYEIEFIKEAGKNIAVTLTAAKVNARTNELLKQSRHQAEELASQEEEMRQNLEELQATQEESRRREAEMSGILNALNSSFYVLELGLDGTVMNVNEQYLQRIGFSKEQAMNRSFGEFSPLAEDKHRMDQLFETMKIGKSWVEEVRQPLPDGEVAWFREYFNPIFDKEGNPYKVLNISFNITRQKELQQEIEQSKAKSEGILDALNSSIGIVDFYFDDPYWRVESANQIFLDSLDMRLEEVKDQLHSYFVSAEEANSSQYSDFWQDLSQGVKRSVERRYTLDNSSEVWKFETFTPVKDKEGRVQSIIMLAIDITAAKQSELEAKKQSEKLAEKEKEARDRLAEVEKLSHKSEQQRHEMESILQAIDETAYYAEFDINGYFTNVNKPLLELMGVQRKDVIGKHQSKVVKRNRYSSEYIQFWNDLRNGISKQVEEKIEVINGRSFWVYQTFMPITNKDKKIDRIFNLVFDISQQKEQEQKLEDISRELENQKKKLSEKLEEHEALIEAVNQSLMAAIYDAEGNILFVNELYANVTGYTVEELKGGHTSDFIKSDELSEYRYMMHRMREGEALHAEVHRTNKQGEKVWVKTSYIPHLDAQNNLKRIYAFGVDITAYKQAEEKAKETIRQLEEKLGRKS